jgi:hypothetical protein
MKTIPLRMARATCDDLKGLREFFQELSETMERGAPDASLGYVVVKYWRGLVETAWERVLMGYEVMLANACDPTASTLEWKPDIARALAAAGLLQEGE